MAEYQFTITRNIVMRVAVSVQADSEDEAREKCRKGDYLYQEEIERIHESFNSIRSLDATEHEF